MNGLANNLVDEGKVERTTLLSPISSLPPDTTHLDDSWQEEPRYSRIQPLTLAAISRSPSNSPVNHNGQVREVDYDLYESPHALLVLVDLPGVSPDQVSLSLGSRALHLEAVVTESARGYGLKPARYELALEMPPWVEADAVDAVMVHGLMRIRIATTKAQDAQIEIATEAD